MNTTTTTVPNPRCRRAGAAADQLTAQPAPPSYQPQSPTAGTVTTPLPHAHHQRPWTVRRWRLAMVLAALAVLATIGLRGRPPSLPQILTVLAGAHLRWIALAVALQAISITMFALQERVPLAALGVPVSVRRIVAIALARSAISITFPAGAAVSAGYAVRQYRHAGSSYEVATATMVVSGLLSFGGLTTLYVLGSATLVAHNPAIVAAWPLSVILSATLVAALTSVALHQWRRRRSPPPTTDQAASTPAGRTGRYLRLITTTVRDAWRASATLRPRHWLTALTYAATNWLTDLLCLAASTHALGLPINLTTLAGIYLGVQIVRQVPITPGGVGLIETAFITGLTAAGLTSVSAAAAVLIYRLLSCWLLVPTGGIAALALRQASVRAGPLR